MFNDLFNLPNRIKNMQSLSLTPRGLSSFPLVDRFFTALSPIHT